MPLFSVEQTASNVITYLLSETTRGQALAKILEIAAELSKLYPNYYSLAWVQNVRNGERNVSGRLEKLISDLNATQTELDNYINCCELVIKFVFENKKHFKVAESNNRFICNLIIAAHTALEITSPVDLAALVAAHEQNAWEQKLPDFAAELNVQKVAYLARKKEARDEPQSSLQVAAECDAEFSERATRSSDTDDAKTQWDSEDEGLSYLLIKPMLFRPLGTTGKPCVSAPKFSPVQSEHDLSRLSAAPETQEMDRATAVLEWHPGLVSPTASPSPQRYRTPQPALGDEGPVFWTAAWDSGSGFAFSTDNSGVIERAETPMSRIGVNPFI